MKRLAVAVAAACLGWLAGAFWPTHTASAACNQFNEALYLVGFAAPGTTPWQGVDNPDPSFGASSGFGTGFHGNQPQNSILDSVILKSTAGRDANESASVSTQTAVPGGYEMFLALGVAGPALSDMEAQVEVSYLPAERTAWFGAEVNSLSNGQKAVTWSVPSSITVTSVTLSASLAPLAGC